MAPPVATEVSKDINTKKKSLNGSSRGDKDKINCNPQNVTPFGVPGDLFALRGSGYTTSQVLAQHSAYSLSDVVFSYSPSGFGLDHALAQWSANSQKAASGKVPSVHFLDVRPGAGSLMLGYFSSSLAGSSGSPLSSLAAAILPSSALTYLKPVLFRYYRSTAALVSKSSSASCKHPLVMHVSALDYCAESGRLVSDYNPILDTVQSLGASVVSSINAQDAQFCAFVATAIAKFAGSAPLVLNCQDGILGSRESSFVANQLDAALLFDKLEAVGKSVVAGQTSQSDRVKAIWAESNKQLGTQFDMFDAESFGSGDKVYVGLGSQQWTLARELARENNGTAVNVRLYSPLFAEQLIAALPSAVSISSIVALSEQLFTQIALALRFSTSATPETAKIPVTHHHVSQNESHVGALGDTHAHPDVVLYNSPTVGDALARTLASDPSSRISHLTVYDNETHGQVSQTCIKVVHGVSPSKFALFSSPELTQHFDVPFESDGGSVVVLGSKKADNGESLAKSMGAQFRQGCVDRGLDVYVLDIEAVGEHGQATQGRTGYMVQQIAFWHLAHGMSINDITSKIVFANGNETELVAATVARLAEAVIDTALVKVSSLESWKSTDDASADVPLPLLAGAIPTTFYINDTDSSSGLGDASADDKSQVSQSSLFDTARRIIFAESFDTQHSLRPDVTSKNFIAKVKVNERVTPDDYDRHIFHLELDITGTGLKYAIGEALGVHAPNNIQQVNEFMQNYGVDPSEVVSVTREDGYVDTKPVTSVLRDNLDLFGKPPKKFYEALIDYATDAKQKSQLEHLVSSAGKDALKERAEVKTETYADVLAEFHSARPSLNELVSLISPLKRREYSIASSQKVHPNAVHLLIVVVDWVDSFGRKRYGQTSKFLADLNSGAEVVVSVKPSVMKLPTDPSTPVIMSGLGTGLAPFKAFLEEKAWQKSQGHEIGDIYLFLGSRHQRQEYLYGELFEAYKNAGILTYIGAAFSRDQPQKIYIQDRIREAKHHLIEAFVQKNGSFYLCGPTWPVPDISAALADIVATDAATRNETVDSVALIEELKDAERYILEVY